VEEAEGQWVGMEADGLALTVVATTRRVLP
jgi:hypothetical protein